MPLSHDSILQLLQGLEKIPDSDEQMRLVSQLRRCGPAESETLDRYLLSTVRGLREGLGEARQNLNAALEHLKKLAATPWHPATFMGPVTTEEGPRAVVAHGTARRVVGLAEEVRIEDLEVGQEVFLGAEMNIIMAESPLGLPDWGEVASFQRRIDRSRIVLRRRDEDVVVNVAGSLQDTDFQVGDSVRWHPSLWLAYERMERKTHKQFFLEDVPDIGPDQVGGQEANLNRLFSVLNATLLEPDKAREYDLKARQSILMVGPPGCGKTLMARAAAAELKRRTGLMCRFGVVKPSEWEDPYVGVTQRNIREYFQMLREAAKDFLCVVLMDEVECVGRIRGGVVNHHSDKFLAALLDELDGFTDRTRVAIVSASNRKDLIDPAFLQRLSDIEIAVRPPDMRGARSIFGIHLPATLPYQANGHAAEEVRQEMIGTAVSRFYDPNADNALCVVRFRDNKTRTVHARELASGRTFEQICRVARQAAFRRDVENGSRGLCVSDIEDAVVEAIERLKTTLTPQNIHSYLSDLRQDMDVIAIEPVVKKVSRPVRYLNVA